MWIKKLFAVTGLLSVAIVLVMMAMSFASYGMYAADIHDKQRLMNRNKSGLLLLDRNGEPFFSLHQGRPDTYVTLESIPDYVEQAAIAMEDRTFYQNRGYSIRGMIRAALMNAREGRVVQGGSTISQELVKISLLDNRQNLFRKFQEVILATRLNHRYSKPEILEMYLNSVYFGEGAFGIEDAALTYFGIPAEQLSLPQAALLIGLLPAPSRYSPLSNNPDIAHTRQQLVLETMAALGYISPLTLTEAREVNLRYNPTADSLNQHGFHFALYVQEQLAKQFGEEEVVRGGFTVKTTLDLGWQQEAEKTLADQVKQLARNGATNGAVSVIDVPTGQIRAMVGSVDWHNSQFGKVNMAVVPRQVGSAFKPIIYAAAIDNDLITPATILTDRPTQFAVNYKPRNYDGRFRGPVTVRRALANSLNVPAVQVMEYVGVVRGLEAARQFGITSLGKPSDYGLSLVLGSGEVPLVELTNAYAAFADNGVRQPLTTILEIRDKYDQPIAWQRQAPVTAVSAGTAYLISSILSDTRARAEVFGRSLNTNRPAAVKTGTSQDYRNALTVGYTPQLAIGVWIGNNDNSPMDRIAGSLGAAPVWKQLMESYLHDAPKLAFQPPASVTEASVCPYVGTSSPLASASAYTEYFLSGTESYQACKRRHPEPNQQAEDGEVVLSSEAGPEPVYTFTIVETDD